MTDTEVQHQRESVYGDWRINMGTTSDQIDAIARQYRANNPGMPLPEWWAPLVQVVVKLNRMASGRYHPDNFTDARNYLAFVEEMQRAACPGVAEPRITGDTIPESGR